MSVVATEKGVLVAQLMLRPTMDTLLVMRSVLLFTLLTPISHPVPAGNSEPLEAVELVFDERQQGD